MLYDPNWKPADIKLEPWQEVLLKAADILEREGWIQGSLSSPRGHCAAGAIGYAAEKIDGDSPVLYRNTLRNALKRLAAHLGLGNMHSVATWNDNQFRTKEQVIEAMKEAAHAV